MADERPNPLRHLNPTEQDCLRRYVVLLCEQLSDNLLEVHVFGSAARGDMWSERFPFIPTSTYWCWCKSVSHQ